jgi:putative endonuclease
MKKPCVYILSNKSHSTLYTGVTSDIEQRVKQHRNHTFGGFSAKYNLTQLLHFEEFGSMAEAIAREKQIKSWSRKRKDELISDNNPSWKDLMSENV